MLEYDKPYDSTIWRGVRLGQSGRQSVLSLQREQQKKRRLLPPLEIENPNETSDRSTTPLRGLKRLDLTSRQNRRGPRTA